MLRGAIQACSPSPFECLLPKIHRRFILIVSSTTCPSNLGSLSQPTAAAWTNSRNLDAEDQYNATIIEPIFPIDSWYADNPNDPTINYETFVADILPEWVDNNFSTTGSEKNLLVGFSKSGYGALDLEFKHPSVFSAVAAFDFPGDMSSYDDYGSSSSAMLHGTQANFQDNYQMTASFVDSHDASFTTNDRILISEGPAFQSQVADFDMLTYVTRCRAYPPKSNE